MRAPCPRRLSVPPLAEVTRIQAGDSYSAAVTGEAKRPAEVPTLPPHLKAPPPRLNASAEAGDLPRQTVRCAGVYVESFKTPPPSPDPVPPPQNNNFKIVEGEEGFVFPSSLLRCGFHPCTFFIYIITWSFN